MQTSRSEKPSRKRTKRKLTTLNLTLIALAFAQLGIIIFLAKHSRFFHASAKNNVPMTPALELDLAEIVPQFLPAPVIDEGPAVLPAPTSMLVVYHPPQKVAPFQPAPLDVQMHSHEKEIVLDLSAPPMEFVQPLAKKTKPKMIAKSPAKEKKSAAVAKSSVKKNDKREKTVKAARQQPKFERVKIVTLPPKYKSAKASRTVASILPEAQENALDRAASMAADESYHENSARRDTRRKEMARETERVKGVFEEE